MEKKWLQLGLLYCIGLFQGMAWALLPSISNILNSSDYYDFSTHTYGILFIPLVVTAIAALYYAQKYEVRNVLAVGLFCNAIAMLFLALSNVGASKFPINICLLLGITAILGVGLGATMTALFNFKLNRIGLFAWVALGMALPPFMVNYFMQEGLWWLAPVCLFVAFLLLFNFTIFIPMIRFPSDVRKASDFHLPWTFWLFFTVLLLYGFCETSIGNWLPLYTHKIKNLSTSEANLTLASFWMMAAFGRFFINFVTRWMSFRWFYMLLPLMIFWSVGIIPIVILPWDIMIASGIAGLACSAFLPLTLLFSEETHAEEGCIGLMSAYMLGYGLGSYGLGELQHLNKIPLEAIYPFTVLPAALMTILTWCIVYFFPRKQKDS